MKSRAIAITITLLALALACAPPADDRLEANKELVREFAEATNAADWERLEEVTAESFTRHSAATAGPSITSRAQFIEMQKNFLRSFSDQRVELEQLIAEGDLVAARATYSGTLTGPMGDLPATGRRAETPFLALFRIESGRIAELWVEWDNLAMLTQLGLFPPPAQAETRPEAAP